MRRYLVGGLLALSTVLLGACASKEVRSKQTILDETLRSYASTIRWGDIAQAQAFLDPKYREAHPQTALELARYKQVEISGYDEQPATPVNTNEVTQTVQISLINVHTQHERGVVDHQIWKYDEKAKRWWLTTGLPDISRTE
jgi:hypothetical protein